MGTVEKLNQLQNRRNAIAQGGGNAKIQKQHDAGKLTARERILALLDEGSFVEVDAFVAHRCKDFGMSDTEAPGEGVVTGYGTVDARLVYVYAQDFTVMGGALGEMHAKKITKIMDMAIKMGAPLIALNDSAGARIQEGVNALAGYGEIFKRNAKASGVIPQISVVMGPCVGGAVYSPALSDFIFMVEGTSQMFVTGPNVIKGVTGADVTMDDFGAKAHAEKSGVAHFTAKDEKECIEKLRKLISFLPSNNIEGSPFDMPADEINRVSETLTNIIPDDANAAYDVKTVIKEIVDNADFFEVMENYAKNIVIGFAKMNGQTVGIVANQSEVKNGVLDNNASDKAARFIRFCDCFNIPVITFTDVEGFVIDAAEEANGLIRHGAKLMYAYAEATVAKINVILRKAYGNAYIAMCSKSMGADFVMAWPTAEVSVMPPEGAANIILGDKLKGSNNPVQDRDKIIEEYREKYTNPYEAAKFGYIDDIIEPDSTRPRIIAALEMLASKRESAPAKKHGNIPM